MRAFPTTSRSSPEAADAAGDAELGWSRVISGSWERERADTVTA
jgi:hypothetical protein